ncbi:MAG: hypothetical protein AAGI70_03880 [Pseudomonadota bacterium]
MNRLVRRPDRHAMVLIAACFVVSAGMRVADPASAIASELTSLSNLAAVPPPTPQSDLPSSESLAEMLTLIQERQEQLDAKAQRIAERARIIEVAEIKLREQMAALEAAEQRLAETLRVADRAAEKDVEKLVTAFETMNPKRAAPIFENMDVAFAAGLISRMKGPSAAEVLAGMSAEKAYAISVFIAGQNARAPTE